MKTIIQRIKGSPLNRLKNAEHIAFAEKVVESFGRFPIIEERFERYTSLVRSAFDKERDLYHPALRPLLTKQKNADNSERLNAFYLLRDACRAALRLADPEKKQAAKDLLVVSNQYGGSRLGKLTQGERNGMIDNFIDDLREKFSREVELLSLGSIVDTLASANERYNKSEQRRIDRDAIYQEETMEEARNITSAAIHLLFSMVNNAARAGEYEELSPFINHTNAIIAEYTYGLGNNASTAMLPLVEGEEQSVGPSIE